MINNDNSYCVFRKDRLGTNGGGVCILTRKDTVRASAVKLPIVFSSVEIVAIDIHNCNPPTRLITCYRPPSADTSEEAVKQMQLFTTCLEQLCNVDATILITGDFNLPTIHWINQTLDSNHTQPTCSEIFLQFCNEQALCKLVNDVTKQIKP